MPQDVLLCGARNARLPQYSRIIVFRRSKATRLVRSRG